MAKDILKEAIADAKTVREVALANAKAALEEAFTPRLQSMLSAKLSEELNEEEDLDEAQLSPEEYEERFQEGAKDDKEEVEEAYYEEDKEEVSEEVTDLDEEIDLEEILNELELEEGDDSKEETVDEAKEEDLDEAKDKDEDTMDEAKDEDLDEAKGDKEEEVEEGYQAKANAEATDIQNVTYKAGNIYEDQEFNLDALLEEINNLDENEEEVNEIGDDRKKYRDPHSSDADIDFWKTYSEGEGQTNEVVGVAAAGIAGLIAAAGGLSALETAADDPEWRAKYPKVARALEKMQDIGAAAGQAKRMEEEATAKELEETKAALEAVKSELNEVNLLNSKLLYVNRIFKANNLDEGQKLRVVETLDNADTIKEAKLIYETIKDTFNVANAKKASFKNKTKSLKEGIGMASKAAGTSTAPKKEVIAESTNMVNRFQKLANIKINQ